MRADYIKPSVYTRIYHLMEYENALALRLSLETGLRIGDCLALRPEDIDGCVISYTAQKTGKRGKKKISADLAKRLRKISDKNFVFVGRFGDKPRTRQAVWKDVKKASKALKISENLSPHSARKTYAVEEFHEKGFKEVQKELQHDRAETTMLYAYSDILFKNHNGVADEELKDICIEILETVQDTHRIMQNFCQAVPFRSE